MAKTRSKVALTPNEQNVARILELQSTTINKLMGRALRGGWTQRQLSAVLRDEYGAELSQFGARTLIIKYRGNGK